MSQSKRFREVEPATKTVLVAVTGLASPMLTEALWELPRQGIFIDRLVLVTTSKGKEHVETALFTPPKEEAESQFPGRRVWEVLCEELKAKWGRLPSGMQDWSPDSRHDLLVPGTGHKPTDVRTPQRATTFAESLFQHLEAYKRPNPPWRVIGLLAGGRRPMESLLYACMSLLGTDGDLLYTVTVEPEPWTYADPKFFFPPSQPTRHRWRDKEVKGENPGAAEAKPKDHSSADAKIRLLKLPFPALVPDSVSRPEALRQARTRFKATFSGIEIESPAVNSVQIDPSRNVLKVNEIPVQLNSTLMAVYCFLAARTLAGLAGNRQKQGVLGDELKQWIRHLGASAPRAWEPLIQRGASIGHSLNRLRGALRKAMLTDIENEILPPKRSDPMIPYTEKLVGLPPKFVTAATEPLMPPSNPGPAAGGKSRPASLRPDEYPSEATIRKYSRTHP